MIPRSQQSLESFRFPVPDSLSRRREELWEGKSRSEGVGAGEEVDEDGGDLCTRMRRRVRSGTATERSSKETHEILPLLENASNGGLSRYLLSNNGDADEEVAQSLNALNDATVESDGLVEEGKGSGN